MEVGAEEEAAKNERDSVTSTVSPSTSPLHTQRPLADAKGQTHTRLDTLTLTLIPNDDCKARRMMMMMFIKLVIYYNIKAKLPLGYYPSNGI